MVEKYVNKRYNGNRKPILMNMIVENTIIMKHLRTNSELYKNAQICFFFV